MRQQEIGALSCRACPRAGSCAHAAPPPHTFLLQAKRQAAMLKQRLGRSLVLNEFEQVGRVLSAASGLTRAVGCASLTSCHKLGQRPALVC